jgi:hypothetical protein
MRRRREPPCATPGCAGPAAQRRQPSRDVAPDIAPDGPSPLSFDPPPVPLPDEPSLPPDEPPMPDEPPLPAVEVAPLPSPSPEVGVGTDVWSVVGLPGESGGAEVVCCPVSAPAACSPAVTGGLLPIGAAVGLLFAAAVLPADPVPDRLPPGVRARRPAVGSAGPLDAGADVGCPECPMGTRSG